MAFPNKFNPTETQHRTFDYPPEKKEYGLFHYNIFLWGKKGESRIVIIGQESQESSIVGV
jgi:hypothetical protein